MGYIYLTVLIQNKRKGVQNVLLNTFFDVVFIRCYDSF